MSQASSVNTPLNPIEKRALRYLANTNLTATVAIFDEDHEPIGAKLRDRLVPTFATIHADGRLRITEAGIAALDQDWTPA